MSTPVDKPNGLKPVRYSSGHAYNGACRKYYKSASVIIGIGDPVVLSGTADSDGVPAVTRAAAGSGTISGVVVGIVADPDNLNKKRMEAADSGYLLVADDPDLIFEIQEDGAVSQIAATAVGEFCDIVIADADANTGLSKCELDSSNAGTGDQLRIVARVQREDNDIGNVGTRWEVQINEHTHKAVQTPI